MAFWHRIVKSELKAVSRQSQFCRSYFQLPEAYSLKSTPGRHPLEVPHPYRVFHDRPTSVCSSVRFFAAPIQFEAKQKKEEDSTNGPRLNEQIKARYVRLVTDDGHTIVSRLEALERARELKHDLVEVQRNADPPVCKIMDFHKETYKRQEKEKERAKSKSELTLRKGECKEVRFSEKIEFKDLKMKADMVKKLMEKGYRVKCRATGSENQDSMASLSRLSALIEDVAAVESGPSLAKKEAFMIVRHVKYRPSKKGSVKKLQDAALMAVKAEKDNIESLTASSSDSIEYKNQSSAEPSSNDSVLPAESGNRYRKPDQLGDDKARSNAQEVLSEPSSNYSVSPAESGNRYRKPDQVSDNKVQSNVQAPAAATDNRYQRTEPRNRYQQTTSNNAGLNNRGPGVRDAVRSMPPHLNQMRHVPVDINVNPEVENAKQVFPPGSTNSMPSHEDISKRGVLHPRAPNNPRPGYGIFSATTGPEAHRNREGNNS